MSNTDNLRDAQSLVESRGNLLTIFKANPFRVEVPVHTVPLHLKQLLKLGHSVFFHFAGIEEFLVILEPVAILETFLWVME